MRTTSLPFVGLFSSSNPSSSSITCAMSHRSPSTMRKSSSGHHRQSESRSPLRMRKSCSDHHRNGQSESRSPSMMRKSSSGQSESNALRKHAIRKNHWQPISNEDLNNLLRVVIPPPSKSPWAFHAVPESLADCGLRGSLVRENGHIYSLAAAGDLLYTGSESKNIRVWKNQTEFSAFKSSSGLVKAIVVDADRVLSGHQDGKIRIWRPSEKNPTVYQRVGSLPIPSLKAKIFKNSIKHLDAISCLAFSEDRSLLYSGSWDKTFKVWRVSDSKCLETVKAHDDAVNSIIAAFGGAVLTGSADGSVKVWDSLIVCNEGKTKTKHTLAETLLQQDSAVTALAADPSTSFLYGGSSDGTVVFWERGKSGSLSRGGVLRGHKLAVLCLATARSLVFSGSADTNICVWQRNGDGGHTCLSVLMGHGGPVKCLAVVEDKEASAGGGDRQYVAYSGSLDKSVKIWRATEMVRPPLRWAK